MEKITDTNSIPFLYLDFYNSTVGKDSDNNLIFRLTLKNIGKDLATNIEYSPLNISDNIDERYFVIGDEGKNYLRPNETLDFTINNLGYKDEENKFAIKLISYNSLGNIFTQIFMFEYDKENNKLKRIDKHIEPNKIKTNIPHQVI